MSEDTELPLEGYQWTIPQVSGPIYVYDCLYGIHEPFMESPMTGPHTGAGVQGRSYGLSVVCPVDGSTNVTGPRPARVGERVIAPNQDKITVPGLGLFTGESQNVVQVT